METRTRILHTRVSCEDVGAIVTPIFQNSAFSADSPYFYTRKDNPNTSELESVLSELEECRHAITVGCGMSAIYLLLDLVSPGECVVANRLMYGCTIALFQHVCKQRHIDLQIVDLSGEVEAISVPANTRLVFFETPTNPFLQTIRISEIAVMVRKHAPNAIVAVDNTWATPIFQKPLKHGADISVHSGTKYLAGHSDVMNGVILTDRDDLHAQLLKLRFYSGALLAPQSAWLVRRSLQTLYLRMNQHVYSTLAILDFLEGRSEVDQVWFPVIDGEQLTGYGGILFCQLRPGLEKHYMAFRDALQLFDSGTGMACVTSTVAQPFYGSHASLCEAEKAEMGIDPGLVRLCIGLEAVNDLVADLANAFSHLVKANGK